MDLRGICPYSTSHSEVATVSAVMPQGRVHGVVPDGCGEPRSTSSASHSGFRPTRMKTNREHRVPGERRGASWTARVFPSVRGRALSDAALDRELGIPAVPHGFESFRDWAAECSDAPRQVCELAPAQVNSDRVEAAYRRTDRFERRRANSGKSGRRFWSGLDTRPWQVHGNRPRGEPSPDCRLPSRANVVAPILAGITDTRPNDAPPAGSPQRCPTTHKRRAPASHRRGYASVRPVL